MTNPTDSTDPTEPRPPTLSPDERLSRRYRSRGLDAVGIVWGVILLAVGVWFFLKQTLGWEMPAVDWGDLWPVILIVVGAVVIFQAMRRRTG
jgi:hypothetical protein